MRLAFVLSCLLLLSAPSLAADKDKPVTPLTKLDAATKKMLEGLNENQTKQFAMIRSASGIIRAVEDVEKTVEAANKSCGKQNPEFALTMDKRVGEWKDAVSPVMTNARERLNMMIKLQDFAKPVEVRNYLKKVDEAVAYKSRGAKSVPITEKKECKKLLGKMDDTQEDTIELLMESLELDKPLEQVR